MHIIFVTASMAGGGSERVIAALSEQFIRWEHSVTILMTASDEIAYSLNEGIQVMSLGVRTGGSICKRIGRITALRKYFKMHKNSLVISFGTETNLFSVMAAFGLKQRMILSERNDPNQCTFVRLRNFIYYFGKAFVFQTEDAAKCFSPRVQRRGCVIPNPVLQMLPEPFTGDREKTVVAVGRLTAQKNHVLLLRAFSDFVQTEPEYRLILYGKGELEEELREVAKELGICDNVIFAGFKNPVLEYINRSGMYVLSSDYEGISNSLVEAMAIGLPVISTDCPIGGSRLCIEDGENGLLVPMNDKDKLCEAMLKVASDWEFAEKLSHNATQIRRRFAVEKIARMWLDFGETV